LELVQKLADDPHDLMHKACGWMLREVYKRAPAAALAFLRQHKQRLPRTALRYAIERCEPAVRQELMSHS
jgi:3-methyladenine DNA glycosylase AlkD